MTTVFSVDIETLLNAEPHLFSISKNNNDNNTKKSLVLIIFIKKIIRRIRIRLSEIYEMTGFPIGPDSRRYKLKVNTRHEFYDSCKKIFTTQALKKLIMKILD